MRPASGKLKHDLYARKFEIIDLRRDMKELREEYAAKKKRLQYLLAEEADAQRVARNQ